MKKYLCIYCLLCMAALACAQNLKFNANGKFKIVQFTDVHYISDDPRSDIAIEPTDVILVEIPFTTICPTGPVSSN